MAVQEKSHFSKTVLGLSERAQRSIGHTSLGAQAIRLFNGSRAMNFIQADWYSELSLRGFSAEVTATVRVPGNPSAGWLTRNWNSALVMATPEEEIEKLHERTDNAYFQEAAAYIADDIVHVGVDPNPARLTHDRLFGRVDLGHGLEKAIALRRGRGPLVATMGLWLPGERAFVGVESLRIAYDNVSVGEFCPRSQLLSGVTLLG